MIKGILFDKDGTIIDFDSLWFYATEYVEKKMEKLTGKTLSGEESEKLYNLLGMADGVIDPHGLMAVGTYEEIYVEFGKFFDCSTRELVEELYLEALVAEDAAYEPIGNLRKVLSELKEMGIKTGIATADSTAATNDCIKRLGVEGMFDFLGTIDNYKPKPAKDMFVAFMEKFNLLPEEIAMVGDCPNDIRFSKNNGGVGIAVLSGCSVESDFDLKPDYFINSIDNLPALLKK